MLRIEYFDKERFMRQLSASREEKAGITGVA